jgi:hypothetical protein
MRLEREFAKNALEWSPRQESNLYLALRRHLFYPLNYREATFYFNLGSEFLSPGIKLNNAVAKARLTFELFALGL